MTNHYHLVLHVDEWANDEQSNQQICDRRCLLYSKPVLIERWQSEQVISAAENKPVLAAINRWRACLIDIY